jgi:hypothetical protein
MVFKSGDHWVSCDICSFKCYASESTKTWDNLIVCPDCYDGPRNPQDYLVKPMGERQIVRDARPERPDTPTILETVTPNTITDTTAASGGNITYDGGSSVTAYGVCWSTDMAPTTDDDTTSDGTGTGEFTSAVTGLTAATTYYVRAYAVNSAGTSYGPQKEFTTKA